MEPVGFRSSGTLTVVVPVPQLPRCSHTHRYQCVLPAGGGNDVARPMPRQLSALIKYVPPPGTSRTVTAIEGPTSWWTRAAGLRARPPCQRARRPRLPLQARPAHYVTVTEIMWAARLIMSVESLAADVFRHCDVSPRARRPTRVSVLHTKAHNSRGMSTVTSRCAISRRHPLPRAGVYTTAHQAASPTSSR